MSDRFKSQPILNFMQMWTSDEFDTVHREIMKMYMFPRSVGQRPVEFMKSRLGRQAYTWTGEFRFWVWEGDDWRVYVSNIQGISVEVRATLSASDAREVWKRFAEKLGIVIDRATV